MSAEDHRRNDRPVEFTGCRPVFPVHNVDSSLSYYCGPLGFTEDWRWSDHTAAPVSPTENASPTFASVYRGQFQLFLALRASPIQPVEIVVGLGSVEEVDRLHQEYRSSGAQIEEAASARVWGTYEMRVRDPDHHLLRILTNLPEEA